MGPDVVPERLNVILFNYLGVGLLVELRVVFAYQPELCEVELLVPLFEVFSSSSLESRN